MVGELILAPSAENKDPLALRRGFGLRRDDLERLRTTGDAIDARLLLPAQGITQKVQMIVDQPRNDGAALQIDKLRLRPGERFELSDVISRENAVTFHCEAADDAEVAIHGDELGVVIYRVGRLRRQGGGECEEEESFHRRQPAKLTFRQDDSENVMQAKGLLANIPAMRLLIVEDEPDLLRALTRALREDGYAVDTAEDGEDGRFKALECDYDAIVLDWMLPVMNGLEVLKALRAKKQTPVLMLTAKSAVNHRIEGLNHGADDYLAKPFDINELRARLRALIRRSAGQARDQIVIDEVVIDTWGKFVTLGGTPVVLTAREYALVEYLALRRGKMVSRTELYEHLFDENEDSLSNLLDVRVSLVRKKLGADFIQTRRGQGYCIP